MFRRIVLCYLTLRCRLTRQTVSLAYHCLTSLETSTTQEFSYIIWHKAVPSKISIFICVFFRIDFQQHIIYCGETYFKINNSYVLVVVDLMRITIIYFCTVIFVDQFRIWFGSIMLR